MKLLIYLCFLFTVYSSFAGVCNDILLLDGSETITQYGMDSTCHWWAISQPFDGQYRLTVDGKSTPVFTSIKNLSFSADGKRWACFAQTNTQIYLVTNETSIALPATSMGELAFSPNSESLVYSYYQGEQEFIILKDRTYNILYRQGKFYVDNSGNRIAFIGYRADGFVININGEETTVFEDVMPLGFWYDGQFIYAAKNGNLWEIYKGNKAITEGFISIQDMKINLAGNVAGVLAYRVSGDGVSILISDDYYEPLIGRPYDAVNSLVLHPNQPMLAYKALFQSATLVVLNSTEYSGDVTTSAPYFSHDGSELYFFGCNVDCFANINGQKYSFNATIPTDLTFPFNPGKLLFSYSSSSNMIVRNILKNNIEVCKMADTLIQPRYNWRSNSFETLGVINNRLYLFNYVM